MRAPCDMIIIDSQVPTLFIDTSDVLGNTDLQLRYSIENTKSNNANKMKPTPSTKLFTSKE